MPDRHEESFFRWCERNEEDYRRHIRRAFCLTVGCYKSRGHAGKHGMPES